MSSGGAEQARSRICLYDAAQLEAVLEEIAQRTAGLLTGTDEIVLAGIRRRGAPLARELGRRLAHGFGIRVSEHVELDIKRYADDLSLLYPETRLTEDPAHQELDLSSRSVVVVDDVIYGGHSLLHAVQYLAHKKAEEIRTVVLVDRGAAKLPVRIDVAGVRLDVASSDIIECWIPPFESGWGIHLVQRLRR